MKILDIFRQLYLLLWKNYVLRSRAKIRLLIEIIWPLFLFLILMWVRTRGLRNNEPNCHFAERPLPSAGIIPFVQGLICNLNHSCYDTTQNSFQSTEFFQFLNLTSDTLEFFNQPQIIENAVIIARFINSSIGIRSQSTEITRGLNLSQSLRITEQQFKSVLTASALFPSPLNETIVDKILNSTPNYNYLYSNYSINSTEPAMFLNFGQINQVRPLVNFFYGPDLELAELNRNSNRVDDPSWIRSQTCNGSNYLLKGSDAIYLKEIICLLNDEQITELFIQISTYLDVGKVKRLVYEQTDLSDPQLLGELVDVSLAFLNITGEFQNSQILNNNQFESFQDALNNFTQMGLSASICGNSKLSIFSIIQSLDIGSMSINTLSNIFKENSTSIFLPDDPDNFFDTKKKKTSSMRSESNREALKFDNLNSTSDLDFATEILDRFNNLNRIDPKNCPVNRTEADLDPSAQFLVNSTTKSCFCQSIYAIINGISESSQFLFRQIKPMFLGKVLYAPNTPVYKELIKKINQTFSRIDGIVTALGRTAELSDQLLYQLNQINQSLSQTNGSFNIQTNTTLSDQVTNQLNQINQILSQINGSSPIIEDLTDLTGQILNQINQISQTNSAFNSIILNLLSYKPQLNFTSALLYFVRNSLQCIELNKFEGVASEKELVSTGLKLIDKESFWAGIVFENAEQNSQLPKIVKYKIRMNAALTHDTSFTQDKLYYYGPSNCLGCNAYFTYGFIYLQDMIEKAIVETKTGQSQDMGIIGQMTPYPCYIDDKFLNAISRTLPLFMVLAWIYTVSMLVKDIVYEKEKRLKEFMRVMSLSNGIHWISWFITSFSIMFFIVLILCIVLKFGDILPNSDFSTLLVFFTCFTLATITQCFLISVFFNQANLASVVAGIIYFLLYLPYTVLVNYSDEILPWQKFLASLSSTVAFSYGCELLAAYEKQNLGINWENFYKTPYTNDDPFNMNYLSLILLMDALIYMLLTWYIEGVAPGEFGVARKWYFPVQPSYWCGESTRKKSDSKLKKLADKLTEKMTFLKAKKKAKIVKLDEENFKDDKIKKLLEESVEPVDEQILPGVQIEKLHKVYSRGNNHALKGLSVNFYQNEISAFLGHNGAGKSTTMHLLTGLYSPTSGTALIEGLDITESMDSIRKSLGFVPQHNVLFPQLTVKEHLWFFARLKGLDTKSTEKELDKMLSDTGLRPKKNEHSKNLSGGMQRKLSVAIAFVGGSKTVILDEPSAGVDPAGRRSIWDLLFKFREGRTIIISTHHMDEADVLGDRIAIISNGRLIAHGTSYFLKQKFGQGYYLTFSKKKLSSENIFSEENRSSTNSSQSTDSGARSLYSFSTDPTPDPTRRSSNDVLDQNEEIDLENFEKELLEKEEKLINSLQTVQDTNLCRFVKNRIQNAILVENIGSEMTFSISNKPEYTKTYEKFFQQVESNMDTLGIDTIGISDTTLEEIFIKLAKQPKSNTFDKEKKICGINFSRIKKRVKNFSLFKSADKANQTLTPEVLEKYSDYTKKRVESSLLVSVQQLYALLIKRLHRLKRNIKGFFAEIVLPVVFVCLALLVATLTPNPSDRPPLELHPWYYRTPNLMFLSRSSSFEFDKTFYSPTGQSNVVTNFSVQPNIDQINQIVEALLNNPGPGNRCMKGHRIRMQKSSYQNKGSDQLLQCEDFDNYQTFKNSTPNYSFINELLSTNYTFTKRSKECDCSEGFPQCPASAGGDIFYRNFYKLKTKDIVYDLTGRNISDWLIKTELNDNIFQRRYGGYEFLVPRLGLNSEQISNFLNNLILLNNQFNTPANSTSFTSNSLTSINNVKLWYNTKGYDANVAYLNIINNAFMRNKLADKKIDPTEHGIVAINHPMSYTRSQFIEQLERRIMIDLFVAICIIFALSFIPASFLVFLLEERANNSKQLQFVSGVKPYVYWISNFVWDLVNYMIPTCLCIIIFAIFGVQAYMSKENAPCLVALMLLYGWACIPLMYPLNYLFKIPSTAFVISSSLNVFIGVITTMTTTVLGQLGEEDKELKEINKILKPIFIILFPHYCLGQGFIEMAELYTVSEVKKSFGFKGDYDPFEFNKVGRNLLALTIQGFVYFLLNLLLQYQFFIRFKPVKDLEKLKLAEDTEPEDEDVRSERKRILNNVMNEKYRKKIRFKNLKKMFNKDLDISKKSEDDAQINEDYVRLVNLTKVYRKWKKYRFKKHTAVKDLCIGLNKGECFGLIGVNGAGKTTSFKMITGEISISGGDVYVNNYSVSRQIEKVHQNIGYCPQSDAIFPLLTAREHLIFYARLRGIPEKYVKQVSEWAMYRVGLTVFADRISRDFSGGNKRKLSTAIALVGNPSVICLDEPTSGMDAKARRLLWNDIISLIKENRLVILTSHSMEECEALCTRLVIMVNGQFKCLGSPQHLKTKFGNGFKLSIRLNDNTNKRKLQDFMKRKFPSSKIQETHRNLYEYVLPFNHNKLSAIFGLIESNRENLGVKDYSVSQTTLDQVFINFAKLQNDSDFMEKDQINEEIEDSLEQNNSILAINNSENNSNENSQELAEFDSNNNINEKINESDSEAKNEKEFEENLNILPKTEEVNNGEIVNITKL